MTAEERAGLARKRGLQISALTDLTAELSAERGQLLRELAEIDGWTTRRIATDIGVSQPRVQQLLNAARGINPAGWGGSARANKEG